MTPLTLDDDVLLRAIALVGDVVRERELTFLITHWDWSAPFDGDRVAALEAAGCIERTGHGYFVPADVAAAVADRVPLGLHPALLRLVGEMLAFEADSFERLRMGIRRLLAQPNEATILEACRRWAQSEAGMAGPRGELFVEAIGAGRMSRRFRGQVARVVPELSRDGAGAFGAWVARMWPSARPAAVRTSTTAMLLFGALLGAGACGGTAARPVSVAVVEPTVPSWYPDPPATDGLIVAAAADEAREIRRAVEAADAKSREGLAVLLRAHLAGVVDSLRTEVGGADGATLARGLRSMLQHVAREQADSAAQRDYRIVPRPRGYRAYVMVEVRRTVVERAFAARLAEDAEVLARVQGTAAFRRMNSP